MTDVKDVLQKSNTSLYGLSTNLWEHGRHAMLLFRSSLPLPVLRILDIGAKKSPNALLTRRYTQHALRSLIDSEINHKRHFIKVPFIN